MKIINTSSLASKKYKTSGLYTPALGFQKKDSLKFVCQPKDREIRLEITDIPIETRRIIIGVEKPNEETTGNPSNWVIWKILKPRETNSTLNKNTKLKEENLAKGTKVKTNDNLFDFLCRPEIKGYKLSAYATDNTPNPDLEKEDLKKVLEQHAIDSENIFITFDDEQN